LFLDEPARAACAQRGWLLRRDCQFHWCNRGYTSFDDYLGTFTAEKRKKARRERRRVADAGVRFETRFGGEPDEPLLDRIYARHPGRAQGEPRIRARHHLVRALHRRSAVPRRHCRVPGARSRGGAGLRAAGAGSRSLSRPAHHRAAVKTITWLSAQDAPEWFPPLEQALEEPSGLLAAGGDLSPERLIAAYRRGIFPWYSPGQPVLWWSPDPRAVLF